MAQRLCADAVMLHVRLTRRLGYIPVYSDMPEFEAAWHAPPCRLAHQIRLGVLPVVWRVDASMRCYLPAVPPDSVAITVPVHAPTGQAVALTAIYARGMDAERQQHVTCAMQMTADAVLGAVYQMVLQDGPVSRRSICAAYGVSGYVPKNIARVCGLSVNTVRHYVRDGQESL
ncbi:hypothetical protein N8I74_15800 [Chitiniphilus purpureus]|uniref:Helix-turn-helix domain-containing protein n=1 Tax=Chitiniphilus purpureus TaxID=2981137 RepID=A0ABY6DK74_9NEIS|nr:hypothetical protein [Chitiniphilus sp. CD1]UXY14767.1 hypothetical protein N8I74_15800 [Chitiniphilus sp. CD1]